MPREALKVIQFEPDLCTGKLVVFYLSDGRGRLNGLRRWYGRRAEDCAVKGHRLHPYAFIVEGADCGHTRALFHAWLAEHGLSNKIKRYEPSPAPLPTRR